MKKQFLLSLAFIFFFILQNSAQKDWTQISGIYGGHINTLSIIGDTLFATHGDQVLYYSIDDGNNWIKVSALEFANNIAQFKDKLYATGALADGSYFGLLYSNDAGNTWQKCSNCPKNFSKIEVGTHFIIAEPGGERGIYRSYDGEEWTELTYPSNWGSGYYKIKDHQLIFGSRYSYYSSNDGNNWELLEDNNENAIYFGSFCFSDTALFAAYDENIFYSKNHNQWTSIRKNLANDVEVLQCYFAGGRLFIYTSVGTFYWSQTNENWTFLENVPLSLYQGSIFSNDSYLFYKTSIGLFKTENLQNSWTDISQGFHYTNINGFTRQGDRLFVLSPGRLFVSEDEGISWNVLLYSGSLQTSNALSDVNHEKVWFNTDKGLYQYNILSNELTLAQGAPEITGFRSNGEDLYAFNSSKIYKLDSENQNWIDLNCPEYKVYDMVVFDDGLVVSGHYKGVLHLENEMSSWMTLNNGISYDILYTNDTVYNSPWKLLVKDRVYAASNQYETMGEQVVIQFLNMEENRWQDSLFITDEDINLSYLYHDLELIDEEFYMSGLNIYKYSKDQFSWSDISGSLWYYSGGHQKEVYQIFPYEENIYLATNAGLWKMDHQNMISETKSKIFEILPNPNNGIFMIKYPSHLEEVRISIFDIHGSKLEEFREFNDEIYIDIKAYPTGVYLLRMNSESHLLIKN